jgi:hypothetical protein
MNGRDLTPPTPAAKSGPVWELWLGYDLEQCYEFFVEPFFWTPDAFPDQVIEELREVRSWLEHHLRASGIPDVLISAADRAIAGVRRRTQATDADSRRRRWWVAQTFEVLLQLSRAHSVPHRRRYFDYGVVLRRIAFCEIARRHASDASEKARPDEAARRMHEAYRREHRRTCANMVEYVREDETTNPFDSGLRELDVRFAEFADYLAEWLEGDNEPDEVFREHLRAVQNAAGFLNMTG